MEYYKIMQLGDMIEAGLVTPSQYMDWADDIIISTDEPDSFVLELCVERLPDSACNLLRLTLGEMEIPRKDCNEDYSWEQENYYIGYLYLRTKYQNLPLNDFLRQAGFYSDGMSTQWNCEEFFELAKGADDEKTIEIFLSDWLKYVDGAEKIYKSFHFD